MKKYLLLKKLKILFRGLIAINDLNGEEIIGTFYEKELQRTNQGEFRIEKVVRRNCKMSQYYRPYRSSRNNIKVELDLANYQQKLI